MFESLMKSYGRSYFSLGFATGLHDLLMPEAYRQSLRAAVEAIPEKRGRVLVDSGCGDGACLRELAGRFCRDDVYVGLDIERAGLAAFRKAAFNGRRVALLADLRRGLPLASSVADMVLDHFTIYMLVSRDQRRSVWSEYRRILKPEGLLYCVCPGKLYDAERIYAESKNLAAGLNAGGDLWRFLGYWFGLRFVESAIRKGERHGFALDELLREVAEAGFEVLDHKLVYAGCAYQLTARPVSFARHSALNSPTR